MKILHTADWHIGSFKGPEKEGVNLRSEDTMKCLRSLVETAEKEKPDLVLVSGDIFHQAEIWQGRSHKEVLQAREIILALSRAAGQVIVMRGTPNHDSEEAFLELKAHFEFIDNVKIVITPELVRTSYADIVAVPGFDKGTFRAQHPGISKEDENIVFSEELGKIVVGMRAMCSGDVPAVLMSHYTVPGCNTESGQTQFLTQFEPVITQDMLLAADYDLVALGHIHRPQMINGLRNVYYSGAVNAMNFNDEGQDRGFWLYEMKRFSNEKWDISDAWFRKTPYREFITFHFTDTDITAINLGHIEEVAFNYWTYNGAVADKIVRVLYTCSAEQKKIFNTALLEKALYEAGAFWVAGIEAEKIESANRTELSKQEDPETNLIQYLQEKLIEPKKIDSIVEKARPIIAKAKANSAVSEFFGTFVPKEIEVKNYRNYVEQYFSFEDISFCTINGSNGSGKSSLFMDAIVDCLYEEPREGTNTGWIRNDEKARSGSISFTFGLGDKMFRVVRTRTKSGKPTLNLSELLENEWVDRSKEKIADTQKEIIRLLGMDSLTFKACVLIMQDQYGLFLEAGKEERVGVLSNLLGLGIYGIMEDLAKDELGNLKRDIAKKRQTINIHSATIESYGKPEDEKTEIELKLNTVSEDRNNLAKQKEDKSLLLRMQMEAQERHDKVQASVNTLMQKNEQEGQNIAALERNIESCNAFLADEEETILKVERYDLLLEQDREYAKAAVAYMGKHEELVRIHDQEMSEEQNISRLKTELQGKQDEKNEMILDSANDGEVRQKAGEYEQAKKALDEAFDADRTYKAKMQELTDVRYERSTLIAKYNAVREGLESKLAGLKKQAELLDNVECVDIENAKCGFLTEAISAKKMLEDYPDFVKQKEEEHQKELEPLDEKKATIEEELSQMENPEEKIIELQSRCNELKPWTKKLDEVGARENRMALIQASIENIKSNIAEAEKRLSETKLKGIEVEKEMLSYQSQTEQHKSIQQELIGLADYVAKSKEYPVYKERRSNAQRTLFEAQERKKEFEKELDDARKELAATVGATMDTTALTAEVANIDSKIADIDIQITSYQQRIGSLSQKLDEIKKLKTEIAELSKEAGALSVDISEYELLKAAFSQDGIPHQIIRSLVPKLTEISSSILGQMTGGKMGIEFQTEKVMKSNSNKEVVTLDIFIEEYGKSVLPYLSKSGGEKVKASLSVILALAEIKSSTAGIQLGMLFIDEPPFLDSDGIQAYCDALETIRSRYPDLKIMAITHDPTMKARFPQSLDVVKTDEGSKVIY